jgi:hypothetical protein
MFEVRNCRFSHGEVLPLLCRSPHHTPVAMPLIFTVLRRRHRAVSTLRRDAQIFRWLYEWGHFQFGRDLDELIVAGDMSIVIDKLEQFAYWLRTGRTSANVVGRIGRCEGDGSVDWLRPTSFNGYLHTVQLFLTWAVAHSWSKRRRIQIRYAVSAANFERQAERILDLESRISSLQAALDQQIEMMCRVIANATARGWDVEHLLQPLMPNNRNLSK